MRLGVDEEREIGVDAWSESEEITGSISCEYWLQEAATLSGTFDWKESITIDFCTCLEAVGLE